MPRPRKEKGPPPIETLPESLRMATVRIMARYNIDLKEAYDKLAILADQNSHAFDKAVNKKAESLYKSRVMTQMNAARTSINDRANAKLQLKYNEGYKKGYAQAKDDHAIYFYCDVCRKPVYVPPNSNAHQAVVDAMAERNWGHSSCHNK